MSEVFDAYHKWLGIPPNEQPPDHYRLLGVRRFESDLDVIEHAADQRMAHIRSFQSGPHAMQSQRLLNELSAARRNLLDSDWKAKHDEAVRATLKVQEPGVAASPPPPPGTPYPPDRQGQTHSEIPCPVCGGPLPGEYRKCMHCRSELVWENGIPSESIAGEQIIVASLAQETNPDTPFTPIDNSELERIRTSMAYQLGTKFRNYANDRSTLLAVGICLVFGILYWVLPSSPLLATLFGVSLVATVAYLASRHNFRL